MDATELVRAHYEALDHDEYDRFESLLVPEFTHERPDRTLTGRDAFVEFMRHGRTLKDTTHELREIIVDGETAVAEGTLRDADGDELFTFADVHEFADGRIREIRTYTDYRGD